MKKLIFFILAGILLFSLVGITSAEVEKHTPHVISSGQGNETGNQVSEVRIQEQTQIQVEDIQIQVEDIQIQEQNQVDSEMMVGNDSDEHNCKASTGHTWCESKGKCIRSWEENCTSVKIMPETASATAIAKLGIKNCNASEGCTIVLKEIGSGNQTKATYEVKARKETKLFGFIKKDMEVTAEVDAETGEVISTKGPWWRILTFE